MYITGSQIITVTDPTTGQPVQQLIQNVVDPKTGKTSQIVSQIPASNCNTTGSPNTQVIMVKDPKTGKPVQQLVQTVTDPKTGKTMQIPCNPGPGSNGAPQVVMVPDPVSGKLTPQLVATDPKMGAQIPVSGGSNQQIITVTDPATGQPVQQIVQTVIDPKTGKPTQVTTPLTQNGKFARLYLLCMELLLVHDLFRSLVEQNQWIQN